MGALREKMHKGAFNEDRLCFVYVNEGCRSCDPMPRPYRDHWQRHIAECPIINREQAWMRIMCIRRVAITHGRLAGVIIFGSGVSLRWTLSA